MLKINQLNCGYDGKIVVKDITGKKDDNIQLGIKLAESILEV